MTGRRPITAFDCALYAVVVFAWGFSWVAMHYQVGTVAPDVSVVWRFAIAAPVMFAIAASRGERLRFSFADHATFMALGVFLFCTNFMLFYYAAHYVVSGLLSVVFALASIVNAVLGLAVLRMPIDRRVMAGAALGAIGTAAMFYPQLAGTELDRSAMLGLLLGLGGTLSFCIGNMISARLQRRSVPVVAASAYGMMYGASALALVATLRGHAFAVELSWHYLGGLVYLALVGSVLAFTSYLTLLGRVGPDRAAYVTVLGPAVAPTVSTFAENYRWSVPAAIGFAAVFVGIVLVLRPPAK
jgi:drug/metabolite transporter (DMT)-like permease